MCFGDMLCPTYQLSPEVCRFSVCPLSIIGQPLAVKVTSVCVPHFPPTREMSWPFLWGLVILCAQLCGHSGHLLCYGSDTPTDSDRWGGVYVYDRQKHTNEVQREGCTSEQREGNLKTENPLSLNTALSQSGSNMNNKDFKEGCRCHIKCKSTDKLIL